MSSSLRARNAVGLAFAVNGFCFATLFSRIPALRSGLDLDNSALGLVLLVGMTGSVLALPTAGALIRRTSAATVVRVGVGLCALGLPLTAVGAENGSVVIAVVGLFANGAGVGWWDVAMNVEGAAVEQRLVRAIMPRFHAGFSLGSMAGAGLAVGVLAIDVSMVAHFVLASAVALAVIPVTRSFLPAVSVDEPATPAGSAWREPRTVLVGVMVLAFALAEGAANDWLSLALIDGYGAPRWVGAAGFAVFVTAMTVGRLTGTVLLDRFGRVPVLRATAVLALAGLLLLVLGPHPVLVGLGVALWGLGASLGFPVGMSVASDDPARAAPRVSVVATIGYVAFLLGPPLLGFVGDQVGTLESLLVVAVLLVPTTLLVSVAREPAPLNLNSVSGRRQGPRGRRPAHGWRGERG